MNLSIYIITLNEESRIEKTLMQAAKVADEILVVDSGSTDKTLEIASSYNTQILHNNWESYCQQKSFAEQHCTNDWVLMLDADEVLSDALVEEITKLKNNTPQYNAYKLKIINMFPCDEKPRRFAHSFNPVRLYNRNYASMPPELFNKDRIQVADSQKIGQLENPILHYCILSIEQATAKYNLHSSELVKTLTAEKRTLSKLRLFTEFPRQFMHYYFGKRYCLLGSNGLIQAYILANFRFLKLAKYYEHLQAEKTKKQKD